MLQRLRKEAASLGARFCCGALERKIFTLVPIYTQLRGVAGSSAWQHCCSIALRSQSFCGGAGLPGLPRGSITTLGVAERPDPVQEHIGLVCIHVGSGSMAESALSLTMSQSDPPRLRKVYGP